LAEILGDQAAGLPANAVVDDTPEYETYLEETMSKPIVEEEADAYEFDT
jgi:hypothetical protein